MDNCPHSLEWCIEILGCKLGSDLPDRLDLLFYWTTPELEELYTISPEITAMVFLLSVERVVLLKEDFIDSLRVTVKRIQEFFSVIDTISPMDDVITIEGFIDAPTLRNLNDYMGKNPRIGLLIILTCLINYCPGITERTSVNDYFDYFNNYIL